MATPTKQQKRAKRAKAKAKQILDDLLAKDPSTLNPDRVPETAEEFRDARKLRAELGK